MYTDRKNFYQKIEQERNSKVIAYVTGDRPGMGAQIGADAPDLFLEHLDAIGKVNKISLILYTCGGNTLAAWNIVNLFREFCNELEVIVPNKCRSSGTLMALGANSIIMTKQATLGPIDPSIVRSMSPTIPGTNPPQQLSISVESVKGYFSLLKEEFGAKSDEALSAAYTKLSEYIHPLVLGDVYRTQKQIQMLAEKMLRMHRTDKRSIKSIVSFLCSDSGSHDYTISFKEAQQLGLNVELVDDKLNTLINKWYELISDEMLLKTPYNPVLELAQTQSKTYEYIRVILDSITYGRERYVSKGTLQKIVYQTGVPNQQINDNRIFEGWEKDATK